MLIEAQQMRGIGRRLGGEGFDLGTLEAKNGAPEQFQAQTVHLVGPRRTHSALHYLRKRGAVSEEELKAVRDTAKKSGRDIDRVLMEDKIVSRDAWVLAVKDKVVSGMFSIFEWSEPFVEVSADPLVPPSGSVMVFLGLGSEPIAKPREFMAMRSMAA